MLCGPRLYLRPPFLEEMSYIRKLWSDPASMKDVGGVQLMDEERAERWFERWVDPGEPSRFYCLVFRREDDIPIGAACYYNFDRQTGWALYSMNIEACHRGHGYAREVLYIMSKYFFLRAGGTVLLDNIALDNVRAQKVLLKFGFEHDGTLGSDAFWVKLTRDRFFRRYGGKESDATCRSGVSN